MIKETHSPKYDRAAYLRRRERVLAQLKEKYAEDPKAGARYEAKKRARRQQENPGRYILTHIRSRCKSRGIEFAITEKDIVVPERCPLLDIPLEFGDNNCKAASPSVDRIDNTKGYVPGNVWVISHRANTMKGNSSTEELRTFCSNVMCLIEEGKL